MKKILVSDKKTKQMLLKPETDNKYQDAKIHRGSPIDLHFFFFLRFAIETATGSFFIPIREG